MGVKVWGWAVPVGAPRGEVNVRAMYGSGGKVARWRGKRNVCTHVVRSSELKAQCIVVGGICRL